MTALLTTGIVKNNAVLHCHLFVVVLMSNCWSKQVVYVSVMHNDSA